MAIITWQNVPIPQFSGIQQGFSNAAQFLNQATKSGLGAVGLIRDHMQDQADRAIMDRMLAIQDPQEYARQMEQGAILGAERGRASLDTLLATDKYQDTLQARADARYKSDRTRRLDADRDRISEAANAALTAAILGDPEQGALELMAAQGHLDNTREIYELLFRGALQQDANAARIESARIRSGTDAAKYERTRLIEEWAGKLYDYRHDIKLFDDMIAELPPELQAAVRDRVWAMDRTESEAQRRREDDNQRFLGNNNAIQGGSSLPPRRNPNGGVTRFGAYNRVVSDGQIPQADGNIVDVSPEAVFGVPLERLTGANVKSYWKRMVETTKSAHPEWRARMNLPEGMGTSAMGIYQLTGENIVGVGKKKGLAEQIWGDNWEDIHIMTPENQEKMARLLFEQNQGKDLKKVWVALPEVYRDPEFTKNLDWEDVRLVIASLESGYRPEAYEREVEIVRDTLNNRQMSPIGLALQQAEQNKDMPLHEVVTEILKTEGVKKNFDREKIHNIISKYLEENRELSPAEAGAIFLHTYGKLDPQKLFGRDRVNAIVKQMQATGKAEIKEHQEIKKYLKNIDNAQKNYELAYEEVYGNRGALVGLQRHPNSRAAAIRYQRALTRLERYSQELEDLVSNLPVKEQPQEVEEEYEEEDPLARTIRAINEQERLSIGGGIPGGFVTPGATSF